MTVIGLGTEVHHPSGFSCDAVYIHQPDWTEQDEESANAARERFGIMKDPAVRQLSVDEFPLSSARAKRNRKKRERRNIR